MKRLATIIAVLTTVMVTAQRIERVEPPNWWVGMEHTKLELLVYGEDLGKFTPEVTGEGVKLLKITKAPNKNYVFLNINLATAQPGMVRVDFKNERGRSKAGFDYELKERKEGASDQEGFTSSDVIFLITPDRFSNGDPSNDVVEGLREQGIDRRDDYARHGGDIRGIINHLDYIADMGFTAIWSSPLLTNDMERASYHGYAMTDFYQVDPRFGNLADYMELSEEAQKRGMKLVMDQVANHIGSGHWWMDDLPFSDWLNFQAEFEAGEKVPYSNHRRTINQDRYASQYDSKGMADGWFVSVMPDLNQRNPYMARYLIQNSIWWIETLGLGGIRQDTYPYPDKKFMAHWAKAIMKEYPKFSIVAEEWSLNPLLVAYWQSGNDNPDKYESHVTSTMDFPMQYQIVQALNEPEAWDTGLVKIYEGLANDFNYVRPHDVMIFPDNHDMSRIYTQLGEDLDKTQMAVGLMMTMPRIGQMYYGTEILMDDSAKPGDHGLIRTDFPGGWEGDTVNAFTGQGLSPEQQTMQNFVKNLLNYRKQSKAITKGRTRHFGPYEGTYVMFRWHGDETVTVILNKNENGISLDLDRFKEMGLQGKTLKNIIDGNTVEWNETLELFKPGITMLTTKK
jgi:glycosidase